MMENIGIISNMRKDADGQKTGCLVAKLLERGLNAYVQREIFSHVGVGTPSDDGFIYRNTDLIISLGGDGTLLAVSRKAAENGIPVLGLNTGRLGFLTETEIADADIVLDALVNKEYEIERRMMLKVVLHKKDGEQVSFNALNDAAVAKASFARIIHLKAYINGEFVYYYPADGLLVSSPTGSTAYSLSAGGPIITPKMECMLLTPICPHSLNIRPIVADSCSEIKIQAIDKNRDVLLTVDGQEGTSLHEGDYITVRKAELHAKLVRINKDNFFRVLRAKLTERLLENNDLIVK